jgi:hypothetical protein
MRGGLMLFCLWFVMAAAKAGAITGLMWAADLPYANAVGWLGWVCVLTAVDVARFKLYVADFAVEQADFE